MSYYTCPNCRGGFPAEEDTDRCPWCSQLIDGRYEPEPRVSIAKTDESDDKPKGVFELFR